MNQISTFFSYYNQIKSIVSSISNLQENCENKIDDVSISIFNSYRKTKHYANPFNLFSKSDVKLYDAKSDLKNKDSIKKIIKIALFALAIVIAYKFLSSIAVVGLLAYKFFKTCKGNTSGKKIEMMERTQKQEENNGTVAENNKPTNPSANPTVAHDPKEVKAMLEEYLGEQPEAENTFASGSEKALDKSNTCGDTTGNDWAKAFKEENPSSQTSTSEATHDMKNSKTPMNRECPTGSCEQNTEKTTDASWATEYAKQDDQWTEEFLTEKPTTTPKERNFDILKEYSELTKKTESMPLKQARNRLNTIMNHLIPAKL